MIIRKLIIILPLVLFILAACKPTIDVVKIEQQESDIPVQLSYSEKGKSFFGMNLFLEYKISCKSLIKRRLNYARYFDFYRNSYNSTTCLFYSKVDSYLNMDGVINDKKISKSDTLKTIILVRYSFTDSIFSPEYFSSIIDSLPVYNKDTVYFVEYGNLKKLKAEYPEFLEYYFKDDSVRFEFDDSDLPFFVRRSKFVHQTPEGPVARPWQRPWINVPVEW